MLKQRRLLAGALAAVVISAAAYVWVIAQQAISESPEESLKRGLKLQRIMAVVQDSETAGKILEACPDAVTVGVPGIQIRNQVSESQQYRALETETENGWLHIAKHLRPELLAVPQDLLSIAKSENAAYAGHVLSLDDLLSAASSRG